MRTLPFICGSCRTAPRRVRNRVTFLRLVAGLTLTIFLAACVHVPSANSASEQRLRAMTFNIRLDLASDGANAWPNRADLVAALIRHEEPDLLGTQEVLLHQKRDLEQALPMYRFAGVGRDDGGDKGEFSPIAWRNDRFEMLETGTFWLSPTPSEPGKGWDAAYPRVASWAKLRDRHSKAHIVVLNTHFDHVGETARLRSAEMIAAWAKPLVASGASVLVMGDFNAAPDTQPMTLLGNTPLSGLRDARTASLEPPYGPPGTFNAFRIESNAAAPIDHIFASPDFRVLRYEVVTQHWGGRLPSDHYPVIVDFGK